MKKLWISSGFLYSSGGRFQSSLGIGLALAGPSIALAGRFANALAINAARGFRGATQKFLTRNAVIGTFAISLEIRKKPMNFTYLPKEKMLTLSWLQAPSRKPPAWQVLLQASKPMSHLEGNNFLMWSHLMLISLHQHPPSSSHIPEVWPKATHPAVQAQSPKVQRNPASLRPRDRARISKSFIVLDAPKVGYQVFLRKLRRRLNFLSLWDCLW